MRRRYTDEQRSELIDLVTRRGSTVASAAKRLGVTASTAYHWMKQVGAGPPGQGSTERYGLSRRAEPLASPTFVRLLRAGDLGSTIAVWVGGAEVEVRRGFDAEFLRAVVERARTSSPPPLPQADQSEAEKEE